MWWRFLTFCLLVTFVLIVVLNYLHDRPVIKLFFKRCCDDGIENDQVVFETFSNNYLKERLVQVDMVFDNGTYVPEYVDIEDVINDLRGKLNVHDPSTRKTLEEFGAVFKDEEDLRDELTEDILKVNAVNVSELNQIANTSVSDTTETNASDLSANKNSSDNETKDDVVELKTEKTDNNRIVVT